MSQENPELQAGQPQASEAFSDQFERKLWFEYLAKLNDRDLQSARASGATTWALIAVAAAILYKGVPLLPRFLSLPGVMSQTALVFCLETDSLLMAIVLIGMWVFYCSVGVEARLRPEHGKRAYWITTVLLQSGCAVLAFLHVWSLFRVTASGFVRATLTALGSYWILNTFWVTTKALRTVRRARTYKYPVLLFTGVQLPPQAPYIAGASAIVLPLSAFPAAALLSYLRYLGLTPNGWLPALTAASQTLVLVSVLFALTIRAVNHPSSYVYRQLERDILLGNLPAAEIKARFITQALGPNIADWFKDLSIKFADAQTKINQVVESAHARLKEIESINERYQLERRGQAKQLLENLRGGLLNQTAVIRALLQQIKQLVEDAHLSLEERELVTALMKEWSTRVDALEASTAPAKELSEKLEALANPSQKPTD